MPRDKRLYMTFPNDFWMHPKIRPLSDSAFRAFVEINGYSRMHDLDGRVSVAAARVNWKPKALGELLANHPQRPSLSLDGDDYVIWNYAEHQETTASRAERVAINTKNGSKGGRPPKGNPTETQSVTEVEPKQKQSQRSESEIEPDVTYDTESGQVPDTSTSGLDSENDVIRQRAQNARIGNLIEVRGYLSKAVGHPINASQAVVLVEAIVSKAKRPVDDVDAYVAVTCRRTALEVQQAFFDLDVEGLAS